MRALLRRDDDHGRSNRKVRRIAQRDGDGTWHPILHLEGDAMKITHVKGKLPNGLMVDISLTDPNGQPARRFVIAGDNGVGKSLLLQAMAYGGDDEIKVTRIKTKDSWRYIRHEPYGHSYAEENDRYVKFFEMLGRQQPVRYYPSFSDVWLRRIFSELPAREDYDGVIFVDNPELGLDVKTDAMLGPALEQLLPHAQFIYATKSPGLWDHAYSFERVMLLQPGDPRGRGSYNGNK